MDKLLWDLGKGATMLAVSVRADTLEYYQVVRYGSEPPATSIAAASKWRQR